MRRYVEKLYVCLEEYLENQSSCLGCDNEGVEVYCWIGDREDARRVGVDAPCRPAAERKSKSMIESVVHSSIPSELRGVPSQRGLLSVGLPDDGRVMAGSLGI